MQQYRCALPAGQRQSRLNREVSGL